MKKRFISYLLIAFVTLQTAIIPSSADGFDPAYYAQKYPDVVNAVGNDADALYQHYINHGSAEGRFQNRQEEIDSLLNATSPGQVQASAPAPAADISSMPGSGTYIDVNIAAQTVSYFENGEMKLSTPCVTGNINAGNGTPTGVFAINTRIPGKYLTGPTWNVWVDRWMRFTPDKAIGFHDANWRSSFGGDIYLTNGSHGCVNLPHDAAMQLFDMASIGTTVVVH